MADDKQKSEEEFEVTDIEIPNIEVPDLVMPEIKIPELKQYPPVELKPLPHMDFNNSFSSTPQPPKWPNATAKDVAAWMKQQVDANDYTYQDQIVYDIIGEFGEKFTHANENGNPAINKDVLDAFRKISPDIVWSRGERLLRKREAGEDPKKRQVD